MRPLKWPLHRFMWWTGGQWWFGRERVLNIRLPSQRRSGQAPKRITRRVLASGRWLRRLRRQAQPRAVRFGRKGRQAR
jgi:hypothetical protein